MKIWEALLTLLEWIGGHLSSVDFNFETLELAPEEFN
jgi:hypothetical protein